MSTESLPDTESFPSCQVCHEDFSLRGPTPYLLPCLHAVCETCVTSTAGGVISCSTCQRQVNLTETHPQKDVVRQREIFHLTVQHRPSELLCTHEDDGNQAVCWCQECEDFLCEYCQTLHESFKVTRKHGVQELADIKPGALDWDDNCIVHTKHFLEFWDKVCKVLVCARCRLEDHAEHVVQDIESAAVTAMKENARKVEDVQLVSTSHRSAIEEMREKLTYTEERPVILNGKINHTLQSLKELLDQREKELVVALSRCTDEAKNQLTVMINNSESGRMMCKTGTEYIEKALLYTSKCDLLSLTKLIEETTQICVASAQPEEQKPLLLPVFCTQDIDKLKSAISSFGKIEKSQAEGAQASGGEMPVADEVHDKYCNKSFKGLGTDLPSNFHGGTEQKTDMCFLYNEATDQSFLLQCSQLKFDKTRVNHTKAQINSEGELVNVAEYRSSGSNKQRFQNYPGTTTTAPFPLTTCLDYMEVLADIQIAEPLDNHELVLEIELYDEESRETAVPVPAAANNVRLNCYSLFVAHCPEHDSVCTYIGSHGVVVHHLPNTLPNRAESYIKLCYGILLDSIAQKTIFFDTTFRELLGTLDVNCSIPLWPMFALYGHGKARVKMDIVESSKILMTPEKKEMLVKALV